MTDAFLQEQSGSAPRERHRRRRQAPHLDQMTPIARQQSLQRGRRNRRRCRRDHSLSSSNSPTAGPVSAPSAPAFDLRPVGHSKNSSTRPLGQILDSDPDSRHPPAQLAHHHQMGHDRVGRVKPRRVSSAAIPVSERRQRTTTPHPRNLAHRRLPPRGACPCGRADSTGRDYPDLPRPSGATSPAAPRLLPPRPAPVGIIAGVGISPVIRYRT